MMKDISVDNKNSMKSAQSLPFDVVAVPHTNISNILDAATNPIPSTVNIKIKVKNKEEMARGLGVTVPKFSTMGPKKLRLITSDTTIISFELFMETENEKMIPKKPRNRFFRLFKPSRCFNNENDDDIYPYVPSSSNKTYRTKSVSDVNDLQEEKKFEEKFALNKNIPPSFLGQCKPGGCLDPPFGEDKYIYKPKYKMLASDRKSTEKQELDKKYIRETKNIGNVLDIPATISQLEHQSPSKSSIKETYSQLLITYPPALSSGEVRVEEETQNKKRKLLSSMENKARISANKFSDTYFMPPKKRKSKVSGQISAEFSKTSIVRYDNLVTKLDTNSSNNQEEPILFTNEVIKKMSVSYILNDDYNTSVNEPINTAKTILAVKSKGSNSDVSGTKLNLVDDTVKKTIDSLANIHSNIINLEGAEIYDTVTKKQENVFETNLDSSSISIHKDMVHTENISTLTKDSRISKFERKSNAMLNLLKLVPNKTDDNHSLQSQKKDKSKSIVENQSLISSSKVNADDTNLEQAIQSDNGTLTNSNNAVIKEIPQTDLQASFTEIAMLDHNKHQFLRTTEYVSSPLYVKEKIQDKVVTDIHQGDLNQNSSFQRVVNAASIANKDKSDTINMFSKTKPDEIGDENKGRDVTTKILTVDAQIKDLRSYKISSEDSFTDLNNAKLNECDKGSSSVVGVVKSGKDIMSDNIDSKQPQPSLQEKNSFTLQIQDKDSALIYNKNESRLSKNEIVKATPSLNLPSPLALIDNTTLTSRSQNENTGVDFENKNSLGTSQISKVSSSLNLPSPLALIEKTNTSLRTQEEDTSGNDHVIYENHNGSNTSQIVKVTSSLNLPSPQALIENTSSTSQIQERNISGNDRIDYNIENSLNTSPSVNVSTSLNRPSPLPLIEKTSSKSRTQEENTSGNDRVNYKTENNLETSPSVNVSTSLNRPSPLPLIEKTSSTLRTQEKNTSGNDRLNYKSENSFDTTPSVKMTSSLSLQSPLALIEKTSSTSRTQAKNTSGNDTINYKNENSLDSSQIVNVSSSLNLQSQLALIKKISLTSRTEAENSSSSDRVNYKTENSLDTSLSVKESSSLNLQSPLASIEKTSSTSRTQEKNTSVNDTTNYKNENSLHSSQIVNVTSSLNLQSPLALIKKISLTSTDRTQAENTSGSDRVNYKTENSLDTSLSVKVSSTLNLPSPVALIEKTSSAFQIQEENTSDNDRVNFENKNSLAKSGIVKVTSSFNLPLESMSSRLRTQKEDTSNDRTEYENRNSLTSPKLPSNLSNRAVTPTDNLHSPGDVVENLININPVKNKSLNNFDLDSRTGISTKDIFIEKEGYVDKDNRAIKNRLQLNNRKIMPIISNNEKATLDSSDSNAFISVKVDDQSKITINDPDVKEKSFDLNISKVYPLISKEGLPNNDETNLTETIAEYDLQNKNSIIDINLGFYTHINDKNQTIIKTFDTSDHQKTDPQDKITVIKSIVRRNDIGIRIPVNSELDLSLHVKKINDKGNGSKQGFDHIKKESTNSRKSLNNNKDMLLHETLGSVYENLLPIENIIKNLKQEADFLANQQVLLREILNMMRTPPVKVINTNKCNCNKYFM